MKIETQHELPERKQQSGTYIETIKAMKVGDSVFIQMEGNAGDCEFYNNAKVYASGKDISFTGRKVENGVRVWRAS